MSDDNPSELDEFDRKLKSARERIEGSGPKSQFSPIDNLAGISMRISIELVVGLCVGLGIGWLIDRSLGTKPWFMLVFMFVGLAAGVLNVWRMGKEIERRNAEADKGKG